MPSRNIIKQSKQHLEATGRTAYSCIWREKAKMCSTIVAPVPWHCAVINVQDISRSHLLCFCRFRPSNRKRCPSRKHARERSPKQAYFWTRRFLCSSSLGFKLSQVVPALASGTWCASVWAEIAQYHKNNVVYQENMQYEPVFRE